MTGKAQAERQAAYPLLSLSSFESECANALAELGAGVDQVERQAQVFGPSHQDVFAENLVQNPFSATKIMSQFQKSVEDFLAEQAGTEPPARELDFDSTRGSR